MADLISHRLMTHSMGAPHNEAAEGDFYKKDFVIERIFEIQLG